MSAAHETDFQCYLHMADASQSLFGDVLTVRKVTVLSTGSLKCWRVSANLADRFWLSERTEEHVLNALFTFVTIRIRNLSTIKNFVREADVFGNSRYVFDLIPPDRCPLCRPFTAERSMGGLLPTWDTHSESSHESPPAARVEPRRRARRKNVPPDERKAAPPETPPPSEKDSE